jgi:integrase
MKLTKQNLLAIEEAFKAGGKADQIVFDEDLPGFGLRLRNSGRRVWVIQYEHHGSSKRLTLGNLQILDPAKARFLAKEQLAKVTLGSDPGAEKAQERMQAKLKVRSVIEQYLTARQGKVRPSSFYEMARYLRKAWKPLHHMPIKKVERANVAAVLRDLAKYPTAAGQARSALTTFFAWAIREGFCDENPAINTNNPAEGIESRKRVLDDDELAKIWNACGDDDYGRIIRLLILTGARREEIGGLRWGELKDGIWTLPAHRAKNHCELILPLPQIARNIIGTIKRREFSDHLFGGKIGFTSWFFTKKNLDERGGITGWRIHDLRRSAATGMANLGTQPHVIECILNHQSGSKRGVAGVYNKSPYAREMKIALELWADHIRTIVEGSERTVIPMRGNPIPA